MTVPIKPESITDSPTVIGCEQGLVRLSDRVGRLIHGFDAPEHREAVRQLRREVRAMEIQLEAARNRHCFCPDCRDKVREEECLRCQVQRLTRRLRKYEPNA